VFVIVEKGKTERQRKDVINGLKETMRGFEKGIVFCHDNFFWREGKLPGLKTEILLVNFLGASKL
jgi:hypothetical protein